MKEREGKFRERIERGREGREKGRNSEIGRENRDRERKS